MGEGAARRDRLPRPRQGEVTTTRTAPLARPARARLHSAAEPIAARAAELSDAIDAITDGMVAQMGPKLPKALGGSKE